ncbi:hypothetical protein ACFL1Y_01465 [Patescibacteria group bacterium]
MTVARHLDLCKQAEIKKSLNEMTKEAGGYFFLVALFWLIFMGIIWFAEISYGISLKTTIQIFGKPTWLYNLSTNFSSFFKYCLSLTSLVVIFIGLIFPYEKIYHYFHHSEKEK